MRGEADLSVVYRETLRNCTVSDDLFRRSRYETHTEEVYQCTPGHPRGHHSILSRARLLPRDWVPDPTTCGSSAGVSAPP